MRAVVGMSCGWNARIRWTTEEVFFSSPKWAESLRTTLWKVLGRSGRARRGDNLVNGFRFDRADIDTKGDLFEDVLRENAGWRTRAVRHATR